MTDKIKKHVFTSQPTDLDYILGNLPVGPHQPGTIRKFIYFAGEHIGYLWSFSYHPISARHIPVMRMEI